MDGAAPLSVPASHFIRLLCIGKLSWKESRHHRAWGLGHMGVKIAHALAAEVTVLSRSLRKQEDGKRMGADKFDATSDPETSKRLKGYFDLIINTLAVEISFKIY